MRHVKSIKSAELFPAVIELLQNDQKVRISVTGDSMMPFLREDTDSVELSGASYDKLRFGQIPLIRRDSGQYILHRLIRKSGGSFYIAGDAQFWIEGPLRPDQLVAIVTRVWRGDSPLSPFFWHTLSYLWWFRLPAYYVLRKPYRLLKRIYRAIVRR